MSKDYWDNQHKRVFGTKNDTEPNAFALYAKDFFPKTSKILEIGTGKGDDAKYLKDLGYDVTAIDFSEEGINQARKKYKDISFMNVDIVNSLPFPDNSFDVVYSQMALHYFDEQKTKEIFKEIDRVLAPNGVVAIMTNTIDDPEKDSPLFEKVEEGFYKNTENNITKRYFSLEQMHNFTKDFFNTLVLDNEGKAFYKLDLPLIRFIGKKK